MDGIFFLDALRRVLSKGWPIILNIDQGAQFADNVFTTGLLAANIQVSRDDRSLGNVFCEHLWRGVKYGNISLEGYYSVCQLDAV